MLINSIIYSVPAGLWQALCTSREYAVFFFPKDGNGILGMISGFIEYFFSEMSDIKSELTKGLTYF